MATSTTAALRASAQRLFPNLDWDQILAQLLLERAQRNLIKYRTMAREYEAKYGQDFQSFRQTILTTQPFFPVEQDYFDWEMAVTGVTDMEDEIKRLRKLAS